MTMLNEMMSLINDEPEDEEDELPQSLDFEKFMSELFEKVEDEDWMERPVKEIIYSSLRLKSKNSDIMRDQENV